MAGNGDLSMTEAEWRDDVQQVYIRMMTDIGDYVMHPSFGANLSELYGRPQSPETGQLGVKLIESSLDREGRFNKSATIHAVPTDYDKIRFDVTVTSGSMEKIILSVEQDLGVV